MKKAARLQACAVHSTVPLMNCKAALALARTNSRAPFNKLATGCGKRRMAAIPTDIRSAALVPFENICCQFSESIDIVAAFKEEERWRPQCCDSLAKAKVVRPLERKPRDRIILKRIETQGHQHDIR